MFPIVIKNAQNSLILIMTPVKRIHNKDVCLRTFILYNYITTKVSLQKDDLVISYDLISQFGTKTSVIYPSLHSIIYLSAGLRRVGR